MKVHCAIINLSGVCLPEACYYNSLVYWILLSFDDTKIHIHVILTQTNKDT